MTTVQLRPTFLLDTELSESDVMQCIRKSVADSPDNLEGQFTSHHAMISIAESKRHFWSPWLHLDVTTVDGRRQIFGRFSPHPSIWTGFLFSYLAIGVLVFFAVIVGVSQQLSRQSPNAYYFIPMLLFVAAVLWIASKTGQRLAHVEMDTMRSTIEQCVRRGQTGS